MHINPTAYELKVAKVKARLDEARWWVKKLRSEGVEVLYSDLERVKKWKKKLKKLTN